MTAAGPGVPLDHGLGLGFPSLFRPLQWLSSVGRWHGYVPNGERWFGFDAVRAMSGLPPEILLVPLIGHTMGHAGVAIQRDSGSWLLHCGDAYFHHGEMQPEYSCPVGLRAYQWLMEVDREKRLMNQRRLRELVKIHSHEVRVFSAHDLVEFEHLREMTAGAVHPEAERGFVPSSKPVPELA